MCEFNAKTKGDLQLHIRAKHRESNDNSTETILDPEIVVVESDIVTSLNCDQCDFSCLIEADLNAHNDLNHMVLKEKKVTEIKLEVFALVDTDNVLETRKLIIEKLSEQEEVEEVLKVFVSKVESYFDVNNIK